MARFHHVARRLLVVVIVVMRIPNLTTSLRMETRKLLLTQLIAVCYFLYYHHHQSLPPIQQQQLNTNNSTNSSNNRSVHGDDDGNPPSNSRRTAPQSLLEAVRGSAVLPQPRMRRSVSEIRAVTHQIMDTLMRKNTREAYKYRILEFQGFCATIYNWQTECTRFTVTGEKMYQFMFYQVFRDQKTNNKKPGVFNVADYDRLCDNYVAILNAHNGTISGNETAILEEMEPKNPLSFSSISTYCSAVRKLYDYQAEEGNGSNSLNWDTQICTTGIKNLLKIVQVSIIVLNRTAIQMNVELTSDSLPRGGQLV